VGRRGRAAPQHRALPRYLELFPTSRSRSRRQLTCCACVLGECAVWLFTTDHGLPWFIYPLAVSVIVCGCLHLVRVCACVHKSCCHIAHSSRTLVALRRRTTWRTPGSGFTSSCRPPSTSRSSSRALLSFSSCCALELVQS
jgi:hypothetical protein